MAKETMPAESAGVAEGANVSPSTYVSKSREEIIDELTKRGAKAYNAVRVTNVEVFKEKNQYGKYPVKVVIAKPVAAKFRNPNGEGSIDVESRVIWTNVENLVGLIKGDGRYIGKLKIVAENSDYLVDFLGGGTINIMAEPVVKGQMWRSVFADAHEAQEQERDDVKFTIVDFDPNPVIKVQDLAAGLIGRVPMENLVQLMSYKA